MASCDEILDDLRQAIDTAVSSDDVVDIWRVYVNTYLDCAQHPEVDTISTPDPVPLAKEIVDSLGSSKESLPSEELVEIAVDQITAIRNQKEIPSTDPSVQAVHHEADPIMMFNGQFVHEGHDLSIAGAGIDCTFVRTYKNQVAYRGPLGFNWDHNYNLWLRVSNQVIFRSTGDLREDAYVQHPKFGEAGFNYWVPPDGQDAIIIEHGTSFVCRTPGGDRFIYEQDLEHPFLHQISRIEDRHGNYLAFRYQDNKLYQVEINHPSRLVELRYDQQSRICAIIDYTGRQWRYYYDDFGDLITVITPGTDRYPEGLTTCYEYSSAQFSGELQHNLTRIIDAAGQMYLENEYGAELGRLNFNRVIRQRQGTGESTFEYDDVVQEFAFDYSEAERPAHQTIMIARNGHSIGHVYNESGNLLFKEECILQNGRLRLLVWRYRYNRDGALVATLSPEGVMTQHLYRREFFVRRFDIADEDLVARDDHLTAEERQGFGRLLASVHRGQYYGLTELDLARDIWGDLFPDIFGGLDSDDIVVKLSYEPTYGQLHTASDPRFTNNPDPNAIDEHPRHQETLTEYIYDGPVDDPNRFLARIRRPTPIFPDGTPAGPVVEEFTDYDDRGRLLRHIDPAGVVSELTYFDPADGVREGHLRRTVVDPGGLAIATEYEVDELGRVVAAHLPRSVGAPTGHFVVRTEYNALDQVVRITASPPFNFETRRFYDRNGKLEREERDVRDETGADIPDAPEIRTFAYDEEFNLIRETLGGADLSARLIAQHCYDSAGKRAQTILPSGNKLRFVYDERLQPIAQTAGAGTADAATTRIEYDGDGRVRRIRSARGHATTFTLDPFGRGVAQEDALGHVTRRTYDKLGNLTVERVFERREDSTYALVARGEVEYDALGRAIRAGMNRFDDPLLAINLDSHFLASPGPGELLVMQTFFDAKGRVIRTVDPLGREQQIEYDALDRAIAATDALGNRIESRYDAHSNLVRSDMHDLVRDPATGDVIGERVFSQSTTYDELDRMVTSTDSLGNTTNYAYDSRGNLLRRVDPLGNVLRNQFDILGRSVAQIREQTETGLGGGAPLAKATTRFEYDANGNVLAVVDVRGRRTRQTYDALDRRRAVIYPNGAQSSFSYDADSNLILAQDNNGLRRHFTVDALGRTTHVSVDRSELPAGLLVEGSNDEAYSYDALGRLRHEENDFARCDVRFNSLGWPLEETLTFTTSDAPLAGSLTMARAYSNAGAITLLTYPGGRTLQHHRDALDRLTRLQNLAKGADYPGQAATPDIHDIVTCEYAGRQRARCAFGNGAEVGYRHDGAGRLIEIAHLSGATPLLTLQYLFDAVGNMRFRNDITPAERIGEAFGYDSFYWLARVQERNDLPFDPAPLAPASAPPPEPLPDRQAVINALIGPLDLIPSTETLSYDLVGNRQTEQLAGDGTLAYDANELDQYTQVDGTSFTYDRNGNLRQDDERAYRYDSLNRLVRVTEISGGAQIQFCHDARGRRILELRGEQATHLVYDGPELIVEYRNSVPFAQYVHDDGVDRPIQIAAEGDEHWYHADLVGSVRILTGQPTAEPARYRYAPFGDMLEAPGTGPYNPLRYTARRLDEDLETYDFRARQYDPELGRFLQRDPAGVVDGTNLYAYAGNNPLAFTDPFGNEKRPEVATFEERPDAGSPDAGYFLLPEGGVNDIGHPDLYVDPNAPVVGEVTARKTTGGIEAGANYLGEGAAWWGNAFVWLVAGSAENVASGIGSVEEGLCGEPGCAPYALGPAGVTLEGVGLGLKWAATWLRARRVSAVEVEYLYRRMSFGEATKTLSEGAIQPSRLNYTWVSTNKLYAYNYPTLTGTGNYDVVLEFELNPGATDYLNKLVGPKFERGAVNFGIPKLHLQQFNKQFLSNTRVYSTQPTMLDIMRRDAKFSGVVPRKPYGYEESLPPSGNYGQ